MGVIGNDKEAEKENNNVPFAFIRLAESKCIILTDTKYALWMNDSVRVRAGASRHVSATMMTSMMLL